MSSAPSDFAKLNLSMLGYASKKDIIENLFIKCLIESYGRLDKKMGMENEIRDRFRNDLYFNDQSLLKKWLQGNIIYLDWENWSFARSGKLGRSDFAFKLSGIKFVAECKRLKTADIKYIKDGLNRFVNLQYSEGDEYAGMIGFVVSDDLNNICKGLHDKIKALQHTNAIGNISAIPSFNSNHTRIDKTQINIYHLFFEFMD